MLVQEHLLKTAFGSAAPEHFAWQTSSPFVSDRERALVRTAFLPLGKKVLDLGCGEGATLWHLGGPEGGGPEGAVGLDLFEEKLAFARSRIPGCHFATGSAYAIPFPAHSFDHILIRDVVHHLAEPERLVNECLRVLAPRGRIDVLEPCRYNPLIFMHAVAIPAERGELRSTMSFLVNLLRNQFDILLTEHLEALPIHRLLFHPDLGRPELARRPLLSNAVNRLEHWFQRVLPPWSWAYLHVRAVVKKA